MANTTLHRAMWRLGAVFAAAAKKLQYPALATIPVSAAMLHRVETVTPDQTLADAAQLCMRGNQHVPVVAGGRALGVVTKDALAHALAESGPGATISMAEQRSVITVGPSASATDVLQHLRAHPDAVALVVDHGSPVGLLTVELLEDYLGRAA
jgi:predicted transcriptional regulator